MKGNCRLIKLMDSSGSFCSSYYYVYDIRCYCLSRSIVLYRSVFHADIHNRSSHAQTLFATFDISIFSRQRHRTDGLVQQKKEANPIISCFLLLFDRSPLDYRSLDKQINIRTFSIVMVYFHLPEQVKQILPIQLNVNDVFFS